MVERGKNIVLGHAGHFLPGMLFAFLISKHWHAKCSNLSDCDIFEAVRDQIWT